MDLADLSFALEEEAANQLLDYIMCVLSTEEPAKRLIQFFFSLRISS